MAASRRGEKICDDNYNCNNFNGGFECRRAIVRKGQIAPPRNPPQESSSLATVCAAGFHADTGGHCMGIFKDALMQIYHAFKVIFS